MTPTMTEPANVYFNRILCRAPLQDRPFIEPNVKQFSVISCSQCDEWNIDASEVRPGLWRLEWYFWSLDGLYYDIVKTVHVEIHELIDGVWSMHEQQP